MTEETTQETAEISMAEAQNIYRAALSRQAEFAARTGRKEMNGQICLIDGKGAYMPLSVAKAADVLEDEQVRRIMFYAEKLSGEIARFKGHTANDLDCFDALLDQEYRVKKGGKKGNRSYTSYDGTMRVTVNRQDVVDFGVQLQAAKDKVDECLNKWSSDARPELKAIINNAFNVDKRGKINRAAIFKLLSLEIADEDWQLAMQAVKDSIRILDTKTYYRFERRNAAGGWESITLNIAKD